MKQKRDAFLNKLDYTNVIQFILNSNVINVDKSELNKQLQIN